MNNRIRIEVGTRLYCDGRFYAVQGFRRTRAGWKLVQLVRAPFGGASARDGIVELLVSMLLKLIEDGIVATVAPGDPDAGVVPPPPPPAAPSSAQRAAAAIEAAAC